MKTFELPWMRWEGWKRIDGSLKGALPIRQSSLEEYQQGAVIWDGEEECGLILILSGECEVQPLRRERRRVAELLGPGDSIGAGDGSDPKRVIARSEVVVVMRVSEKELLRLLSRRPDLGRVLRAGTHRHDTALGWGERRVVPLHFGRMAVILPLAMGSEAIVDEVASAVAEVGGQRVLLLDLVPGPAQGRVVEWGGKERCALWVRQAVRAERGSGAERLTLQFDNDSASVDALAPLWSHLGLHFSHVLVRLSRELPAAGLAACLRHADLAYVFVEPKPESLFEFSLLVHGTESGAGPGPDTGVTPVFLAPGERPPRDLVQATATAWHQDRAIVLGCEPRDRLTLDAAGKAQARGVAREIAGCRLGLALSSGGAKGLAHIGILQVLEENGIEVDVIAGASMGAYVGAVWASGATGAEMEKLAREVEGRWAWLRLIDPMVPPRRGFIKGDRIRQRLTRSIRGLAFCELPRTLRVVATRLDTFERVVFSSGDVARAVHASLAVPGVCAPVEIDGRPHVDGGIAEPVPVAVLREMGVERVIAVNTLPTPELVRQWVEGNTPPVDGDYGIGAPGRRGFLKQHINYFAYGNILDTMMRSVHAVQIRAAERASRKADLVLHALAPDAHWIDFGNPGKYIALGRRVAEERLDEIKALVAPAPNVYESISERQAVGAVS